jgi:hypothetical protein
MFCTAAVRWATETPAAVAIWGAVVGVNIRRISDLAAAFSSAFAMPLSQFAFKVARICGGPKIATPASAGAGGISPIIAFLMNPKPGFDKPPHIDLLASTNP